METTYLKKYELKVKRVIKVPKKIFYYQEIKESIQRIIQQPDLLHTCNTWKDRMLLDSRNILGDVVDGRILQDVMNLVKKPSSHLNTFGLLLNFDWFQPYKHVSYSVGVVYAVLINLPRHLRYKLENIIIIGVMYLGHMSQRILILILE